ncbi:DUF6171 family protein [Cohnella sp.]|uniref:DUF6171 family protein n=1 Tax=Cohnella sp. TaxID=1883426 RepID=UPI003563AA29
MVQERKQEANCKGCSANVHVTEAQLDRILSKLSLHSEDCVTEEQYAKRLEQCGQCPAMLYGTTCAHCGCFVRVRAKLLDKHCPNPTGSLW